MIARNDADYAEDLAWLRRRAVQECLRCGGRLHNDCDSACRYFAVTASAAELEVVQRPQTSFLRRWTPAAWKGGRQPGASSTGRQHHNRHFEEETWT